MKATLRHLMIAACLAGLAHAAPAQTTARTVPATPQPDTTPDVYSGTRIIQRDADSTDACVQAAVAHARGRPVGEYSYGCQLGRMSFKVVVKKELPNPEPVCTVPRPADAQTVQCTAPQTGSWSQSRAVAQATYPTCWTTGAWTPTEAPAGACIDPLPQPCTNPIPGPESRTQACPSGTSGNPWTQTRSFTRGDAPGCTITAGPWLPTTPPAGACTPIVTPPPSGLVYHFAPSGVNSNPGTAASPKRDLGGVSLNTLPAGTTLLFQRGGTWPLGTAPLVLSNPNSTAERPITFDAYGEGVEPVFTSNSDAAAFQLGGRYDQPQYRFGHWRIRNIKIAAVTRQTGMPQTGIWLIGRVQNVEIENVEITGFWIGIYGSRVTATDTPQNVRVLNSRIVRNGSMGWLGSAEGSRWEGNLFDANNFGGSAREHGFYGSYLNNGVFRNNVLRNNSVVNGVCLGGTWTLHGNTRNLLVEGNLIEQPAAAQTCYGFSVTKGYTNANSGGESFDEVVLRGNTVINSGQCSICVNSAPGIVVEGNRFFREANDFHRAILAPATGENSVPMPGGVIRDNTLCRQTAGGDVALLQWSPTPAVSEGNSTRTGADATTGPCAR